MDAVYFEKIEASPQQGDVIRILFEAFRRGAQVRFSYRKLTGAKSVRKVSPLKLVHYQWRWYLVGLCHLRNAIRVFHLPRMSEVEILPEASVPVTDYAETVENLLKGSFGIFKGGNPVIARILFRQEAARLIQEQVWHTHQKLEKTRQGVVLSVPITDFREIGMKILQFGKRAQVLEPIELRRYVEREAGHGHTSPKGLSILASPSGGINRERARRFPDRGKASS